MAIEVDEPFQADVSSETVTIDLEIHALIPPLTAEERRQLKANLEHDGCRDPLVVWEDILLDGHNRYEICRELSVDFRVLRMSFANRTEAKEWVINNQRGRRNLSASQRAMLAEGLARLKRGRAAASCASTPVNSQTPNAHTCAFTQEEAAESFDVSRRALQQARTVSERGIPALRDAVRDGELSLRQAQKIAKLHHKQQSDSLNKGGETPALEESLTDEVGNVIPKALFESFRARAEFDRASNLLTSLMATINPLLGDPRDATDPIPGGERLAANRQVLLGFIKNARSHIKFGRPYAICPYPHRGPAKCTACLGMGWVTKDVYDRAPAEMKNGAAK